MLQSNSLIKRVARQELPLHCPHCGCDTKLPNLSLNEKINGLRADCPTCGKYIKFVKQRSAIVSKGFVDRIADWVPRLQQNDLLQVKALIDERITKLN